jgi:hypothetical protein
VELLLWNLGEEGKEKGMIVNNIEIRNICLGGGYNDVYCKLLGRGKGE